MRCALSSGAGGPQGLPSCWGDFSAGFLGGAAGTAVFSGSLGVGLGCGTGAAVCVGVGGGVSTVPLASGAAGAGAAGGNAGGGLESAGRSETMTQL
jgi:hypothetical protein